MQRLSVACWLFLLQRIECITPLQELLLNSEEHLKPMHEITDDLIRATDLEMLAIGIRPRHTQNKATVPIIDVPRAFEMNFRQSIASSAPDEVSIGNTRNYLILRNSQATCSGNTLLQTEGTGGATFESLTKNCDKLSDCDFFVWKPAAPINPSIAWTCRSLEWLTPSPALNWVIAVRPSGLSVENFKVDINSKRECTGDRLLKKVHGPLSVNEVGTRCQKDNQCTYFSINFGASHANYIDTIKDYGQISWFCKGPASSSVAVDGWVTGLLTTREDSKSKSSNLESTSGSKKRNKPYTGGNPNTVLNPLNLMTTPTPNGPMVMHKYHKFLKKGDIIDGENFGYSPTTK